MHVSLKDCVDGPSLSCPSAQLLPHDDPPKDHSLEQFVGINIIYVYNFL